MINYAGQSAHSGSIKTYTNLNKILNRFQIPLLHLLEDRMIMDNLLLLFFSFLGICSGVNKVPTIGISFPISSELGFGLFSDWSGSRAKRRLFSCRPHYRVLLYPPPSFFAFPSLSSRIRVVPNIRSFISGIRPYVRFHLPNIRLAG